NEMTQFRYDVILHIEQDQVPQATFELMNWHEHPWEISQIKAYLSESDLSCFAIYNVPNPRLTNIATLLDFNPQKLEQPILPLLEKEKIVIGKHLTTASINLEDLWEIEKLLPYNVEIMWSESSPLTLVDIIFRHRIKGYNSLKTKNCFTKLVQ